MNKRNLFGFTFSVDQHEDGSVKASMNAELTEAGKQTIIGFISGALNVLGEKYPDVIEYHGDSDGDEKSSTSNNESESDKVNKFMNDVNKFMNK